MEFAFGYFTERHYDKMIPGIQLFNQQLYWECHEALEEIWLTDRGDNARFIYWAVIQIAAVCIHARDEKIIGAQGMLAKAKEKFRKARELGVITKENERLNWDELEGLVMGIPDGTNSTLKDFDVLLQFRFPDP